MNDNIPEDRKLLMKSKVKVELPFARARVRRIETAITRRQRSGFLANTALNGGISSIDDEQWFILGQAHQNTFIEELIKYNNRPMDISDIVGAMIGSRTAFQSNRQCAHLEHLLREHRAIYIRFGDKYWPRRFPFPVAELSLKESTRKWDTVRGIRRRNHVEAGRRARRELANVERAFTAVPEQLRTPLIQLEVDSAIWTLVDGPNWVRFARNFIKTKRCPLTSTELIICMADAKVAFKSCDYRSRMRERLRREFIYIARMGYWPANASILLEETEDRVPTRAPKRAADLCSSRAEIRGIASPSQCEKPISLSTV